MVWIIDFSEPAKKKLSKLTKYTQNRLLEYLEDRLAHHEDPFALAVPLSGQETQKWRFRVGDYRIITKINANTVTILVIDIGHRKDIYKDY
jgi:mRNA interferase RelE/StbE